MISFPTETKIPEEISKVFLLQEDHLLGISSGGEVVNCSLFLTHTKSCETRPVWGAC